MKRIIIADDDQGIQEILNLILRQAGYEPELHSNAARLFANDFIEPTLFIIDKQLDHEDGLEVCGFLKSRKNMNTPVIIFSASNHYSKSAKAAGADAFLEKPFQIKTLTNLIHQLTGGPQLIDSEKEKRPLQKVRSGV